MNKDWDESTLSSLRIHELRDLARKIGVKCPTALKKEDIINQVMQILNGESQPYKAPSKKGRPSKSDNQINTLMEFFMPEDVNFDLPIKPQEDFDFFVNMPQVEYNMGKNEVVEGMVEIALNGVGIIRVNNFTTSSEDVFIHEMIIMNNKLQTGDYVEAYAKLIIPNRPRAVTKIISVNKNLKESKKVAEIECKELGKKLKMGDSVLMFSSNPSTNDFALKLFNELNDEVNMYVSAYEKQDLKNTQNQIYAYVNPYGTYKDIYCCYNLAINRAKVISSKTSVSMVINSLSSYYRALEALLCEKVENPAKLNVVVKEEILKCFKILKESGVKVIVVESLKLEPKIKEFFEFELSKIVDDVILK